MPKPKPLKPAERAVLALEVLHNERISPGFLRLTVGGPAMEGFTPMGFDQWFRVFVPNGADGELRAPTRADALWMAEYFLTPKAKRPVGRNLTVRSHRPAGAGRFGDGAELDVDLYLHDDDANSALARWAVAATPGSPFAILDEGRQHHPPAGTEWQLLAGDESALPAILAIVESAGPDLRGRALVELADPADAQEVAVPDGVELRWLERPAGATAGDELLRALGSVDLPAGPGYAFVAGSTRLAKEARRLLTRDRGMPAEHVTGAAYWR